MSLTSERPVPFHSPNMRCDLHDGISFIVLTQAISDGRQGMGGIRRYNTDTISHALQRFESECRSGRNFKVELACIFASYVLEK
jgi:hypothetical protein